MPQATPTRTTDRDRLRSRPSVSSRSLTAENAPVLFRLPIVNPSLQTHASHGPTQPNTPISAYPPPNPDYQPTPQPSAVFPHGTASNNAQPSVTSTSGPELTTSQASAMSPALASASQPSALSPSGSQPPSGSQSAVEDRTTEFAVSPKNSWWEHWSSGVVLILLIIALVTASILALNDGSKSPTDQLAGEPVAALDEFDLSNITIPEVVSGNTEPTTLLPQTSQAVSSSPVPTTPSVNMANNLEPAGEPSPGSSLDLKPAALTLASPQATTPAEASPAAPSPAAPSTQLSAATEATPAATPPAGLDATTQASLGTPANARLTSSASSSSVAFPATPGSAPLASLTVPEPISPPPLFDPSSNGELNSQLPPLPNSNTLGSSPALYDGAAHNSDLHAASQAIAPVKRELPPSMPQMSPRSSSMPGMVTNNTPVDTNLPSFATMLTSAAQPLPGIASPETQPNSPNQPVPSATPDWDATALANAYLHFSEINKASNGTITNRWGSPTSTNLPGDGASTPTTGRGFTLGNQPTR